MPGSITVPPISFQYAFSAKAAHFEITPVPLRYSFRTLPNVLNAVDEVFKRPDVQKRLTEMGAEYVGSSPQALSKQLANDVRTWAKWVKDAGIRAD